MFFYVFLCFFYDFLCFSNGFSMFFYVFLWFFLVFSVFFWFFLVFSVFSGFFLVFSMVFLEKAPGDPPKPLIIFKLRSFQSQPFRFARPAGGPGAGHDRTGSGLPQRNGGRGLRAWACLGPGAYSGCVELFGVDTFGPLHCWGTHTNQNNPKLVPKGLPGAED